MTYRKIKNAHGKYFSLLTLAFLGTGFILGLADIQVANAAMTGCTITQNGVNVKDNPALGMPEKKADRAKEIYVRFGVTLKNTETYTGYTWNETVDGVKQGTLGILTNLVKGGKNTGNLFIERKTIYPGNANEVKFKTSVNYSTQSGPNVTKHSWTDTCSVSFKDHYFDPVKSTFTATEPVKGKTTITVKIVDTQGIPFANTTVKINVVAGSAGTPVFSPATVKTDGAGIATITATASYLGKDTYSAGVPDLAGVNNTGGYPTIDKNVVVTYTAATAAGNAKIYNNTVTTTVPNKANVLNPGLKTPSQTNTPAATETNDEEDNSPAAATPTTQSVPVEDNSDSENTQNVTANTTSTTETDTTPAPLIPSPDILHCSPQAKVLYFEDGQPAYDHIGVNCVINKPAIVTASIYNKSYDAKSEDNSGNLIKVVQIPQMRSAGSFNMNWDGFDDYDQAATLDDYSFVVEAKLASTYKSDISIQKFKIVDAPKTDVTTTNTTTETTSTNANNTNTANTTNTTELRGAAEENVVQTPSKCPGVNYPKDISGSSLESLIKTAYDDCIIKGYVDGTFRENANLTRAEAAKISVLGSGHIAKQGCYDSDCGSPFMDLDTWQGPWVRAAWDLKTVVGIGPTMFAPNRNITKAEAASLLTKAFGWTAHAGCYNANCGAGYPDDIFDDVIHSWEGPYLRTLWEKKVVHTETPHKFFPDRAITRGQFIEMTMKARIASPAVTAAGSTAASNTTTP